MANKKLIVSQDKITAVADAIREKTSTTDTMTLDEMPAKISSISSGGVSYTKTKLPDPIWYLDYEQNKLHIFQDQLVRMFGAEEWIQLTDNDVEIPWTDFSQYYTVRNNSMGNNSTRQIGYTIGSNVDINKVYESVSNGPEYSCRYDNGEFANPSIFPYGGSIYDIPLVKGKHTLKIRYKAANCSVSSPIEFSSKLYSSLNSIGKTSIADSSTNSIVKSTIADNPFTDSNIITLPEYTINEYNLDLSNVKYDSSVTGLLPSLLSLSGNLYTYDKSIAYTFDTSKEGNGITTTSSYYQIANIDGDNIISNFTGDNWNNVSYVKISFTLTEAKNISINYIFNKTSTDYRYDGIFFGAIDKTMSITSNAYYSKSDITNCIYYAGDGSGADEKISTNDTSVHTYTYENVPAGEHYIQLRLYAYWYYDPYRPKITVTPVYEKADTGYYLPSTITVTDADTNEVIPDTDYIYDPYTGDFTIPMTHSWNMTAVASTLKNILDKVSYNMNYNTGIMTLSSTGATSYTYNIDDGEETTTTGDIDLTSLSDKAVHTITSMASADGSRPSTKNSYKVYKNMSDTMAINDIGFVGESTDNDSLHNINARIYYEFSFAYNDEIYKVYSKSVSSESKRYYYFYRWPDTSAPVFTVTDISNTPVYSATIDIFTGNTSNTTTSTSFTLPNFTYAMQVGGKYIVFFGNNRISPYSAEKGYFYILDMTTHKWVARLETKYNVLLLSVDGEYLTLIGSKNGSEAYYTITDKLSILMDSNHNILLGLTPMNISSKTVRVGILNILTPNGRYDISTSNMTSITYNKDTNDYTILAIPTANINNAVDYRDMLYLKNVQLSDFNADNDTVYPTFRINEDVFALTKKHLLTREANNSIIKIYSYSENSTGDGIDMTKVGETTHTSGSGWAMTDENAVYYTSELSSSFSNHIFTAYIRAGNKDVYFFY